MRSLCIRIAFSVALVAVLGLTAGAAAAREVPDGPTLVVGNPNPGDMITPGSLMIQGVAFDPVATTGTGVDRVSVFLGDRDTGGLHLGDATLGAPNPMGSELVQFANAGWTLTTPALKGAGAQYMLSVYARSAITGQETEMEIPVFVGETVHATGGGAAEMVSPESGGGGNLTTPSDSPPNDGSN